MGIKELRKLTKLSQKQFSEKYNIFSDFKF